MSTTLSLEPEIFGTIQPEPATLTVVVSVSDNRPGQVNVFITNNETYLDRVRVLLRPSSTPIQDAQYILYDTPIIAGHTVTVSQVFVNSGDQVIAWTESGASTFTVSGTAFVYA
jgi:hypothetical protein